MERIWLKQYPAGVPAVYRRHPVRSLVELWRKAWRSRSTGKAFICMDNRSATVTRPKCRQPLAPICKARAEKGARVALMMPNVLQYPVSTAAVLRAACVS